MKPAIVHRLPALALAGFAAAANAVDPEAFDPLIAGDNFVEIGLGYVSDDSTRFGRFNALGDEGFFALLGLDYLYRADFDARQPFWLRARAEDAGLDNRRVRLEGGRQGDYFIHAGYRKRTFRSSDGLNTIYQPSDEGRLILPADWIAAGTTAGFEALLPSLRGFDTGTRREQISVGGGRHFSERWTASADFRQEDRSGQHALAGMFGNTGGNPRAAFLPSPVDYRTRLIDFSVDYADRTRQFSIAYHGSLFSNNESSLTFANPYSTIGGWASGTGYPDGVGQLALAPDNSFHQVSSALGWRLGERTRVLAEIAVGRMEQDETFLPFTANPLLAGTITQPLPAASLDGRIDTTAINLRTTGRLGERFRWQIGYRLDDRDNRTEQREFVYIGADSQAQNPAPDSSNRRFNLPYDYRSQRLRLEGTWRLPERTRVSIALQHRRIDRSYTARQRTDEDRVEVRLQRTLTDWLQIGTQAHWDDRTGSAYDGAAGFLAGHDPGYTETLSGQWANLPSLRQYHLADRRRLRLGLSATLTPHPSWSVGLELAGSRDDYRNSEVGLSEAGTRIATINATWSPSRTLSAHAFYSRESLFSDQLGQSFRGGPNRLPDIANPERFWTVDQRDHVDTLGMGIKRAWMDGRLDTELDYVYARARAEQRVRTGQALDSAPLPELNNRLYSFMIRTRYRINEPLSLHLRYWYEGFDSSDWAFDDVEIDQLNNVLLPGERSPDYRVHVISASLQYRF